MSIIVDSDDMNNIIREPRSLTVCETAHILSSDLRCDNDSPNDEGIVDLESIHHGLGPTDERGVARK